MLFSLVHGYFSRRDLYLIFLLFLIELRGEGLVRQHRRDSRRIGIPQRRRAGRFGTEYERTGRMVALFAQRAPGTVPFAIRYINKFALLCRRRHQFESSWKLPERDWIIANMGNQQDHPTFFFSLNIFLNMVVCFAWLCFVHSRCCCCFKMRRERENGSK